MKFNQRKQTRAERTRSTNHEGGEAYEPDSPELALAKVVINNLLEDTYYESDKEQFASVEKEFKAVAETNPEFALKLAKYARQEENLRQVPQALFVLVVEHRPAVEGEPITEEHAAYYAEDYARGIMSRADEPLSVLALWTSRNGTSIPGVLKRSIENAMHQWNEWQYAKWDQPNKEWTYRDLMNLVHPRPRDEQRKRIFEKIVRGPLDKYPDVEPLKQTDTWESTRSEEVTTETIFYGDLEIGESKSVGVFDVQKKVAAAEDEEYTVSATIDNENLADGTLDIEWGDDEVTMSAELTPVGGYRHSLDNMGMFPRIRQARDMLEAGITADELYGDVTDEWIRNSRLYPFRFYQAYKAIGGEVNTGGYGTGFRHNKPDIPQKEKEKALDFLEHAMKVSTENLPDVLEDTFVAVDTSGSMGSPVSGDSDLQCVEIASLFGALVYERGADLAAFATNIEEYHGSRRDSIVTNMKGIQGLHVGGGTSGHLVPKALREYGRDDYSQVVVFTDLQMWGGSFRKEWNAYKEVNPDASLYLVDLNSYGDLVTPEGAQDVYNISGWTENVIDFIDRMEHVDDFIKAIEETEPDD